MQTVIISGTSKLGCREVRGTLKVYAIPRVLAALEVGYMGRLDSCLLNTRIARAKSTTCRGSHAYGQPAHSLTAAEKTSHREHWRENADDRPASPRGGAVSGGCDRVQSDTIDFGADLEYVDRQVACDDIGILDILDRNRATDGGVVIESKRDHGDDEVFGQVSRYMGWISEHMDQPPDLPVAGLIVASEITPRLMSAVGTIPNARLLPYDIRITLIPEIF